MVVVIVVYRRWIVELLFTYPLPITRFVAWMCSIVLEYGFVVTIMSEVILVDTMLKIAWSSAVPLYVEPVFSIRKVFVVDHGLARVVWS